MENQSLRKSTENLERSTKKTKMDFVLSHMPVDICIEPHGSGSSSPLVQGDNGSEGTQRKSFRDSVTGEPLPSFYGSFFDLDDSSSDDESGDEDDAKQEYPIVRLTREEKNYH